jgi:hypothetical protein
MQKNAAMRKIEKAEKNSSLQTKKNRQPPTYLKIDYHEIVKVLVGVV